MSRPQSPVSRAHDKLGVALVRFSLTGHVRGQRIVDVSASSPGFAALFLERGAEHVASLDVGPSPLAPKLRSDPRVSMVERATLKSLPASALPGPFSFFTVDVKFISSRSTLRALAFRLAPEANGIVWVKPQFEHAFSLFEEKAASLGFRIAAKFDAPADNESEIALHLTFAGRSEARARS